MRTLGKSIGWLILAVVILYLIAATILHYAIKPEQYKTFVEKTVYKYTGHSMKINGSLEWSVFPNPSIRMTEVVLKNDAGKRNISPYFAKIKEIHFKLHLIPLFSGKIELSKIILRNAHLNLIYQTAIHNPSPHTQLYPITNKSDTTYKKIPPLTFLQHIILPDVLITQSDINWIDLRHNRITNLNNINLFVKTNANGATIKGGLAIQQHQNKANFNFSSRLEFLNNLNHIHLNDLYLKGSYKTNSHYHHFAIKSNIKLNLNDKNVEIHYKMKWNTLPMVGSYLLNFNSVAKGIDINYQAITNLSTGSINEYGVYHLMDNGVDRFDYLLNVKNVDVKPIIQALHYGNILQGTLNISAQLTGNNKNHQWLPNLDGHGSFSLKQAQFRQLSAIHHLDLALSSIHHNSITNQHGDITIFSSIIGTFKLQNGIVSNQDLKMQAPKIYGMGSGNINFVNNQIDYLLKLWYKNLSDIKVPVVISGSIFNPRITANYTNVGTQLIQKTIQKKVFKNIFNGKKFKFDTIF